MLKFKSCLLVLSFIYASCSDSTSNPTGEQSSTDLASQIQRDSIKQAKRMFRDSVRKSRLTTDSIKPTVLDGTIVNNTQSSLTITSNNNDSTLKTVESFQYIRKKNDYWQHCMYKEVIIELLNAELQETLAKNNKPIAYYSQWFIDLHNPEYTTNEILKYYENRIARELVLIYKSVSIDYNKAYKNESCLIESSK